MYATSHELAIINWIVPLVTFTTETYSVEYQSIIQDVLGPLITAGPFTGSANLSATNEMFLAVIEGLLPDTMYAYRMVSENSVGLVQSFFFNFSTRSLGKFKGMSVYYCVVKYVLEGEKVCGLICLCWTIFMKFLYFPQNLYSWGVAVSYFFVFVLLLKKLSPQKFQLCSIWCVYNIFTNENYPLLYTL